MRLLLLLVGLLIFGLIAPFFAVTTGEVSGLYSDTTTQIVIFAALPILVLVFVYFMLFSDQ
jgi:hypothetical protein